MYSIRNIWKKIKKFRLIAVFTALRWAFVLGVGMFSLGYIAYKEHSNISAEVTADFSDLAEDQQKLINHLTSFLPRLADGQISVALDDELSKTRALAQNVVVSLGQLRAPTSKIDSARFEYRKSLETLIGVTLRIRRDGVADMGADLHNSVQLTTNKAGKFLGEVEDFQGGALPQVIGAFF